MKNKTKKIIAGLGACAIGITSITTITNCNLSDQSEDNEKPKLGGDQTPGKYWDGSDWTGRVSGYLVTWEINHNEMTITYLAHKEYVAVDLVIPSQVVWNNKLYNVIIGDKLFKDCNSIMGKLTIGEYSVNPYKSSIGVEAFYGCYAITEINIANGISEIKKSAFENCFNLKKINYGNYNSVKVIGERAFYYCVSYDEIRLPAGIQRVCKDAYELTGHLLNTSKTVWDKGEISAQSDVYYQYFEAKIENSNDFWVIKLISISSSGYKAEAEKHVVHWDVGGRVQNSGGDRPKGWTWDYTKNCLGFVDYALANNWYMTHVPSGSSTSAGLQVEIGLYTDKSFTIGESAFEGLYSNIKGTYDGALEKVRFQNSNLDVRNIRIYNNAFYKCRNFNDIEFKNSNSNSYVPFMTSEAFDVTTPGYNRENVKFYVKEGDKSATKDLWTRALGLIVKGTSFEIKKV